MDNFAGWNANQIRYLESLLTDSLPGVSGMEVCAIQSLSDGSWRVSYKYERMSGPSIERQGSDYFTCNLRDNSVEDFQLV